jgi:hypothetical protein
MAYNSPTKFDRSSGKSWGSGTCWSEDEIRYVRDHPDMTPSEIGAVLGRPRASVYSIRKKLENVPREEYATKAPGTYVEVLHAWVAEDFELREIWMRWNGYQEVSILRRDKHLMCTLLCTAK